MKNIMFRNGLEVPVGAPAARPTEQVRSVRSVAIFGDDYLGPRWKLVVAETDRVICGTPLVSDRHEPNLRVVSPCAGTVASVELGARRKVERIVITVDTDAEHPYRCDTNISDAPDDRSALVELLLQTGLWPAFSSRPLGHVPSIDDSPSGVFVNACRKTGNSPDPVDMDAGELHWFASGVDALSLLSNNSVYVCQSAPVPLLSGDHPNAVCVRFTGAYSAHLSSTHVHALNDRGDTAAAWAIGWQDVLALGRAIETGTVSWERKVAIGGDAAKSCVFTNAPVGASLRELATGLSARSAKNNQMTVHSGDMVAGSPSSHLHRFDDCVSLKRDFGDLIHDIGKEAVRPLTPKNALLNALPFGEPAIPLMRALMAHDLEAAERLGATLMVEEDVAQLTRQCASGADYGKLLRAALERYGEALR